MKKFHKLLGTTALTLTIVLVLTTTFTGYYLSKHKEILTQFHTMNFAPFVTNVHYDWSLINNQKSSSFKTITDTKKNNFPLCDTLVINVTLENLKFVEEDRTDILVEYTNEHPDTNLYQIDYRAEKIDQTLYVETEYAISDLFIDKEYKSGIVIHVPKNYTFKNMDMTLSMGQVNSDNIYEHVNNLKITSNLGDIRLDITTPKDSLIVDNDAGNMELTVSAPISEFEAKSSFGESKFEFEDTVKSIVCDLDMGNLTLETQKPIDQVSLVTNMGNINATFQEHVNRLTARSDVGNVDMKFHNNQDSTVFLEADMGNVNTDFTVVKENDHPDFKVSADLGNVNLKSIK